MVYRLIAVASLSVLAAGASAVEAARLASSGPAGAFVSSRAWPLAFEQNCGQYDRRVRFVARTPGATVFLTDTGIVAVLRGRTPNAKRRAQAGHDLRVERGGQAEAAAVHLRLLGSNPWPRSYGLHRQAGLVHHLTGSDPSRWRTDIATFGSVSFADVYPGIDLVYYGVVPCGSAPRLEYDFVVRPGADPRRIAFAVDGVSGMRPTSDGRLAGTTAAGPFELTRPSAYQTIGGRRVGRTSAYQIRRETSTSTCVRLAMGAYNRAHPLVIDPGLSYSTLIGATAWDSAAAIAPLADGSVLLAGSTMPSTFPVTSGAYDTSANGFADVFVARLSATGGSLVYSTYVGGSDFEYAFGLAAGADGSAYVTGQTYSADFPITGGAFDTTYNGGSDAFVLKLAPDGRSLSYSTLLGGAGNEDGRSIAVDASGCAYVAGATVSSGFPVTAGAYRATPCGSGDAFIAKVNPSGASLAYSTFLGGQGYDEVNALAIDGSGRVYVCGWTDSVDLPVTAGAFQTVHAGLDDAFATRLAADGGALEYSTYLGGESYEEADAICVGSAGEATVAGWTGSTNFPVTAGSLMPAYAGDGDGFVVRLSASGASILFGTFLGGPGSDGCYGVALGPDGAAWVAGRTASVDFPTTASAFDTSHNGANDGFVAGLSPDGSALRYATFVGGVADEGVNGLALGPGGSVFCCGATSSSDFPTTVGAFSTTLAGSSDAYALRLTVPVTTTLSVADRAGSTGATLTLSATLSHDGGPVASRLVAFEVNGLSVGSGTTSSQGVATCSYALLDPPAVETRTIRATFAGDGSYLASQGTGTLQLQAGATSVQVSDRVATITESVLLRAYLRRSSDSATLNGRTVAFAIDGTSVGAATTGATGTAGRADLNWIVSDGPATRSIAAAYSGETCYLPSGGSGTLTAQSWTTKMVTFGRTSRVSDRTELKARLLRSDNVPLYAKAIDFLVDGTHVITRTTNTDGYASYPYYDIPDGAGAGTRTITCVWAGNGGYGPITRTATLTVLRAIPYIWVLSKSVPRGGLANLYAYFRRLYDYRKQEAKPVRFLVDGTLVAEVQTGAGSEAGVARFIYRTVEGPGIHTIRCEFDGDAWVDAGYGEGRLTIL